MGVTSFKWRNSFTGRMIIGMLAVHTVLIPVLFYVNFSFVESGYREQFINQLRTNNFTLTTSIANAHQDKGIVEVTGILEDALVSGGIVLIAYESASGILIFPESATTVEQLEGF